MERFAQGIEVVAYIHMRFRKSVTVACVSTDVMGHIFPACCGITGLLFLDGACSLRGVLRHAQLLVVCRGQPWWQLCYSLCGYGRPRASYREPGQRICLFEKRFGP